jgi:hypothetical protein
MSKIILKLPKKFCKEKNCINRKACPLYVWTKGGYGLPDLYLNEKYNIECLDYENGECNE